MTVQNVYDTIQSIAPFESQMGFDNAGLLIGSDFQNVTKVGVVLDVTPAIIDQAINQGVDCIVSHHPIIFSGMHSISAQSSVYRAIRNGIAVISAHTNLDAAIGGVNDILASELKLSNVAPLGLPDEPTPAMGRIGILPKVMTDREFAVFVHERLHTRVKYVPTNKTIERVAVCGGSGADFVDVAMSAGAQALVTAEVKHHVFLAAKEAGFMLVDAGHFETEQPTIVPLCQKLSHMLSVPVVVLEQSSPVLYV